MDIQTTPLLPTVSHEVSRGGGAKVTVSASVYTFPLIKVDSIERKMTLCFQAEEIKKTVS